VVRHLTYPDDNAMKYSVQLITRQRGSYTPCIPIMMTDTINRLCALLADRQNLSHK